jgi:cytoskeletal protein CcmA (bactofilin family)
MEKCMKANIVTAIGIALCLNMALPAMVIHNYCKDKQERIRSESGIFNEDYLYLGNELDFSGQAEDLVFLGKRLAFTGTTTLGLMTLCEKLIFSGTSGNGVITAAGEIAVDGTITGNNYVACKSFTMSDSAVVNGNLFIGCAKLSIDGTLNGDLRAGAGEIVINHEIHGNVTAYAGRLILGEKGKINGNLFYSTKEKLSIEDLAKVTGTIHMDENHKWDKEWKSFGKFKKSVGPLIGLGLFLSFVIVGSLLLFVPAFRKLNAQQAEKSFWNSSLWGLIPVLMYPALIVLCFVLIVTIPFAFVLILAFVPIFFFAHIIGTTLAGKYLVTKFKWNITKRHYQFLIGALACVLISWIPIVNFLTMIFISALGWGVYVSFLFNKDVDAAGKSLS